MAFAGIISAPVKSMGYHGRTKIIRLDIDKELLKDILSKIDKIKKILLSNYKPVLLQSKKVKLKNNIFKRLI